MLSSSLELFHPSFLGLKLQVFLAGMLAVGQFDLKRAPLLSITVSALFLTSIPVGGVNSLVHILTSSSRPWLRRARPPSAR